MIDKTDTFRGDWIQEVRHPWRDRSQPDPEALLAEAGHPSCRPPVLAGPASPVACFAAAGGVTSFSACLAALLVV